MKNYKILSIIILLISSINYGFAQKNKLFLAESEKVETIKAIGNIINENYIFPEVSDKIIHFINSKLMEGKYKLIKNKLYTITLATTKKIKTYEIHI